MCFPLPQEPHRVKEHLIPLPGFKPRSVQPVASRNTDYAVPPPVKIFYGSK
jgi:hypothetical protein